MGPAPTMQYQPTNLDGSAHFDVGQDQSWVPQVSGASQHSLCQSTGISQAMESAQSGHASVGDSGQLSNGEQRQPSATINSTADAPASVSAAMDHHAFQNNGQITFEEGTGAGSFHAEMAEMLASSQGINSDFSSIGHQLENPSANQGTEFMAFLDTPQQETQQYVASHEQIQAEGSGLRSSGIAVALANGMSGSDGSGMMMPGNQVGGVPGSLQMQHQLEMQHMMQPSTRAFGLSEGLLVSSTAQQVPIVHQQIGMQAPANQMQMSQPSTHAHHDQMMQPFGHDSAAQAQQIQQMTEMKQVAQAQAQMNQFAQQQEVVHGLAAQTQQYGQQGMAAVSGQMQLAQPSEQIVPQVPLPGQHGTMQQTHDFQQAAQQGGQVQQHLQMQMNQTAAAHSAHQQQAAAAQAAHQQHAVAAKYAQQQNAVAAQVAHEQQAAAAQAAHQHHSAAAQALQQQHAQVAHQAAQHEEKVIQIQQAAHMQQAVVTQMMYTTPDQQQAMQGLPPTAPSNHSLQAQQMAAAMSANSQQLQQDLSAQMGRPGSNSSHHLEVAAGTSLLQVPELQQQQMAPHGQMVHAPSQGHISRHSSQGSLPGNHNQMHAVVSQGTMQPPIQNQHIPASNSSNQMTLDAQQQQAQAQAHAQMAAHMQRQVSDQPGQAVTAAQQALQQQAAAAVQAMTASGILPTTQMVMNAVPPQQQAAVQAAAAVAAAAAREGLPPGAAMAAALAHELGKDSTGLAPNTIPIPVVKQGAGKSGKTVGIPPQKYRCENPLFCLSPFAYCCI
jgi:hypothetical protein